jgi:hypothetical protein
VTYPLSFLIDPSTGFCIDWLLGGKNAVCQEILTKKNSVSQETLTKNLLCGLVLSRNLDKNVFITKKPSIKQGLTVKKKKAFLILGILLLTIAGFVCSAGANPLSQAQYAGNKSPFYKTSISILSTENTPMNNTMLNSNNLSLFLNVTFMKPNGLQDSISHTWVYDEHLSAVYFQADWQQNATYVYNYHYTWPRITEFNYYLNFTGIPDGDHNITVYALQEGIYSTSIYEYYSLDREVNASVFFTIDTVLPVVSVLSVKNATYQTSNVTLSVKVNEPVSQVMYSLDGKENVTISGNRTLTDLPEGEHSLAVYALDLAGNTGTSETIYFSVDLPEPFPTTLVAAASSASVAVVSLGLLVYFKKRNRRHNP